MVSQNLNQDVNWSEYFASIVSVCPWSKAYWQAQKIDVRRWRGEHKITPLGDCVARMWIHKDASPKRLINIGARLNQTRRHEEWLYSHPNYKGYSTPVPILIQQDLETLTQARARNNQKQSIKH